MPLVIVAVLVIALAAAVALPKRQQQQQQNAIAARCRALQAELAGHRVQGGDVVEARKVEQALRACLADASAAGVPVDYAVVGIETARAQHAQIQLEWSHYQSTDYADPLKRGNTLGTMRRVAAELLATLRQAAREATTLDALDQIRGLALEVARGSYDRGLCFDSDARGCGRFGTIEDPWHARALAEWTSLLYPIVGVVPDRPEETRGIWLRVIPRWDHIGIPLDWIPRLARRGPDYGGITVGQVSGLRAAGSDPLLALIDARRSEFRTPLVTAKSEAMADRARAHMRAVLAAAEKA